MEREELIKQLEVDHDLFMSKLDKAIDNKELLHTRVMSLFERARVLKKDAIALRSGMKKGFFQLLFSPNKLGKGISTMLYSLDDTMRNVDNIGNATDPLNMLLTKAAMLKEPSPESRLFMAPKIAEWADDAVVHALGSAVSVYEGQMTSYESRMISMKKSK